jgi:hypothetical protein
MDRETAEELKRHFNVVAEGLRSEIRAVADGVAATNERLDRLESRIGEEFNETRAMIRLSPSASWIAASGLWSRT